jgi:hypothetical protein
MKVDMLLSEKNKDGHVDVQKEVCAAYSRYIQVYRGY